MTTAAAFDAMQRAGRRLGPLHGVPLAHKDMYYRAGKRSTCGSKIRADFRPTYTATVIERLEGAGSISIGGLNMAEFAQNATGHNQHYGHCGNPWNAAYCPGGSSSGSGASVGARLVYAALGSDTGGSIRLPASLCGVTGIKGTQTRVSRYGVMPLSFSADNVGPLARSARDCARIMSVIAGHDPRDPTSSSEPVPDYEAALTGDIRGMKIGVPTNYFLDGVDPDVMAAFETAVEALKQLGAVIVPVTVPHHGCGCDLRLDPVPRRGRGDPRPVDARTAAGLRDPSQCAALRQLRHSGDDLCRGAGAPRRNLEGGGHATCSARSQRSSCRRSGSRRRP